MGQKDIAEKTLEDYNDVFADIVNVLLFDGKEVIKENELSNVKDKSQYKVDGELHEQERDVSKFWIKGKTQIALCGLENQTAIDKDMPLRIMGYDGVSYRAQMLDGKKERYPVVTLVLYFGIEHWKERSLYECMHIPEELKSYMNDYKINVFEISYLSDEKVKMFKSDFRFVAEYFTQMQKNKDYVPSKETIRHVDELLKLMSVLTKDNRYLNALTESKGGIKSMCEVLDRAETRGEIKAYNNMGLSVAEIAKKVNLSEEEITRILEEMKSKS